MKKKNAKKSSDLEAWNQRYRKIQKKIAIRVKTDPRAAMREAHEALDYGVEILLKLIEAKTFFYRLVATDGSEDHVHDDAISSLCSRANWIDDKVAEFARAGDPAALIRIWCGGKQFAEVIHHVAMTNPQRLKLLAGDSLFCPSLRAKPKTFTHDFEAIVKAIGLSDDCIINMDSSAMHQLDKPPTRLVAEILQEIASWRRTIKWDEQSLRNMREASISHPGGEWEKYRNISVEDWLRSQYPRRPEIFIYRQLPAFNKNTVPEWWEKAVKPYLEKRETLERIRGTPFYTSLCKATETHKDYEVRDELKRRCKPKLMSLAKPA